MSQGAKNEDGPERHFNSCEITYRTVNVTIQTTEKVFHIETSVCTR